MISVDCWPFAGRRVKLVLVLVRSTDQIVRVEIEAIRGVEDPDRWNWKGVDSRGNPMVHFVREEHGASLLHSIAEIFPGASEVADAVLSSHAVLVTAVEDSIAARRKCSSRSVAWPQKKGVHEAWRDLSLVATDVVVKAMVG